MMRASLIRASLGRASSARSVPLSFPIRHPLIRALSFWRAVGLGVLAVAAMSAPSASQQASSGSAPATAIVTFTLDFPQSNPEHYLIAVDGAGHARYECNGKVAEDSEEQAYRAEFEVSAGTRARIFLLAKQAQYFAGEIDSGNRKLASTGTKLLSYQDAERSNSARFNYSNLEPVRELTALFQNIAATLEYGQRLTYYHHYQKLALDGELKRMEAQAMNHELSEIQGVAPVLQEILDDTSVINVVRARAKELIEMGSGAATRR
jgi:hypothetical protein